MTLPELDISQFLTVEWLVLAGLMVCAIALTSVVMLGWMRRQINLERKIAKVSGDKLSSEETLRLLEQQKSEVVEGALMKLLPSLLGSVRLNLRRAGLKLDIKIYVLGLLAATFIVLQIKTLPHVPGWAQPLLLMAAFHFAFDRLVLNFLIERRKARMIEQLGMAVEYIVRGIQTGQSVDAAIADAVTEIDNPLHEEMKMIKRLTNLGVPLGEALQAVATEIDLPEFDFFTSAVVAQVESGGNLRAALTNLADVIRSRNQLRLKVAALTAEGKLSAFVLAALPILIFAYLSTTNQRYVEPLYTSEAGPWVLYGGFGLIVFGTYVMLRIVKIRV